MGAHDKVLGATHAPEWTRRVSTASDAARHRCTNPRCDAGPKGKPAKAYGYDWCRVCRMIAAVKRSAARARGVFNVDDTGPSIGVVDDSVAYRLPTIARG